jgi:flagellar hook-associated protein 2
MSSIGGVGSGLDIQRLVSQLVAAERAPQAQRLSQVESTARSQLSSLGSISSVLGGLKSAAAGFSSATGIGARTVSLSSTSYLTASASSSAQTGSYSIDVISLARAAKQSSSPQTSIDTSLGSGALTLSVGGSAFTVNPGGGPITLGELRDSINSATNNTGVAATLVSADDGVRLVLTGRDTSNAQVRVDGNLTSSATNTFASAIAGVSFTATKSETDPVATRTTLTVGRDNGAARTQVEGFVSSVNSVLSTVKVTTLFNTSTGVSSPLTGDALPRTLVSQLRNALGAAVPGQPAGFESLNSVGISFQADGSLKLDAARFDKAMNENPQAVSALFTGGNGYTGMGARISSLVDSFTGTNGVITSRNKSINDRIANVGRQVDALDLRMERVQKNYLAQFTAMEKIVAQLQGTSSFLSNQLSQLSNLNR